jgi:hypothetical protein
MSIDWYKSARALNAAGSFRVLILSVHGVIFRPVAYEGSDAPLRPRSPTDGQALSHLRAMLGTPILVLTNERAERAGAITKVVEGWNKLPSCISGTWPAVELQTGVGPQQKLRVATEFLNRHNIASGDAAFFGHGFVDIQLLSNVGFPCAPSDADPEVRELCTFVSDAPGGNGALTELAQLVAAARGIDRKMLPVG